MDHQKSSSTNSANSLLDILKSRKPKQDMDLTKIGQEQSACESLSLKEFIPTPTAFEDLTTLVRPTFDQSPQQQLTSTPIQLPHLISPPNDTPTVSLKSIVDPLAVQEKQNQRKQRKSKSKHSNDRNLSADNIAANENIHDHKNPLLPPNDACAHPDLLNETFNRQKRTATSSLVPTDSHSFEKPASSSKTKYTKKIKDLSTSTDEQLNHKLYQRALWYCSKSEQLSAQLSQKLIRTLNDWSIQKERHPIIVQFVLDKLISYNYLNDERYCMSYLRARSGKKSFKVLLKELSFKGASKDILEQCTLNFEQAHASQDIAINSVSQQVHSLWISKFKGIIPDRQDTKGRNKQMRYFASRGFPLKYLFILWKSSPDDYPDESSL